MLANTCAGLADKRFSRRGGAPRREWQASKRPDWGVYEAMTGAPRSEGGLRQRGPAAARPSQLVSARRPSEWNTLRTCLRRGVLESVSVVSKRKCFYSDIPQSSWGGAIGSEFFYPSVIYEFICFCPQIPNYTWKFSENACAQFQSCRGSHCYLCELKDLCPTHFLVFIFISDLHEYLSEKPQDIPRKQHI